MQQYAAASAHFQTVLLSDAAHLHDSAALAAALAELHSTAEPAGMRRAVELLEQRGLSELTHTLSLPVHDRWGWLWGGQHGCPVATAVATWCLLPYTSDGLLTDGGCCLGTALALTVCCRTAALVTNALVAQRAGDGSNAAVLLTKALKTAHSHLGNTQMVAQASPGWGATRAGNNCWVF